LAAPVGNTSTNLSFCPKAAMPALLPNRTSSRPSRLSRLSRLARLSRHRQRTTRQLARALRGAVALLPVAAAVQALPAMAQAQAGQSAARDYAIPAGPLGTVLSQFASQAGILLSSDAAITAGLSGSGIRGRFTVDEGFAVALAGTGLQAVRGAGNVYALQRGAASETRSETLSEVRVTGQRTGSLAPVTVTASAEEESGKGPGKGFVAQRSTGGTKTDTPLLETPQSVSVVTRDQMDSQGATTLVESLRYTPGIVAQYGNTDLRLDWLTLRGFTPPARYLDNLRLPFGARGYSQPRIEPWGLERVEVVKGPSLVLYGQSTPGGLVNMVSKRPTLETVRQVEVQLGSHNRRQTAFDFGGAIDDEGVWSYRLVGLHREAGTAYDYVSEKKSYFAPSLTFRPSDATRITLLAHWQTLDSPGGGGAPALPSAGTLDTGRYAALPTRAFVGEPGYDRFNNRQHFVGYEAEHKLDDTFTLRQNLRYGKVDAYTQRVQAFCLAACNPSSLLRYAWAFPETARLLTVDTQVQADFHTGPGAPHGAGGGGLLRREVGVRRDQPAHHHHALQRLSAGVRARQRPGAAGGHAHRPAAPPDRLLPAGPDALGPLEPGARRAQRPRHHRHPHAQHEPAARGQRRSARRQVHRPRGADVQLRQRRGALRELLHLVPARGRHRPPGQRVPADHRQADRGGREVPARGIESAADRGRLRAHAAERAHARPAEPRLQRADRRGCACAGWSSRRADRCSRAWTPSPRTPTPTAA
jgi:hypothetical protein